MSDITAKGKRAGIIEVKHKRSVSETLFEEASGNNINKRRKNKLKSIINIPPVKYIFYR